MLVRAAALLVVLRGASAAAASKFASLLSATSILAVRSNGGTALVDEYQSSTVNQASPIQTATATGCSLATGANQAYGASMIFCERTFGRPV